jgi:hypothetical protein
MKRVFFDTNIFNKIVDHSNAIGAIERLKQAETRCEVELVTGVHVLEELLATPKPDRRQRLVECILSLSALKITKSWNQLIREEMQAYLRGQEVPDVFVEDKKQKTYYEVLKSVGRADLSAKCVQLQEEMKKDKKAALGTQESLYQRDRNLVGNFHSQQPIFDEFYEQVWRKAVPDQVRKLLQRDGVGRCKLDQSVAIVASKSDELSHLRAFLRAAPALVWFEAKGWSPKWGDRIDLQHLICAATSDVLVSTDGKLKEIFCCVYPEKSTFALEQLLLHT